LPDGFKLAPENASPRNSKRNFSVYFTQYSDDQPQPFFLWGPLPAICTQEIVLPILSPDSRHDSNIHCGKYSLAFVAENRGRGQVYPHR